MIEMEGVRRCAGRYQIVIMNGLDMSLEVGEAAVDMEFLENVHIMVYSVEVRVRMYRDQLCV